MDDDAPGNFCFISGVSQRISPRSGFGHLETRGQHAEVNTIASWDGRGKVMGLFLKSAYLPYDSKDGARYLVETLWPEGVDTYELSPFHWVHELSPSYDMKAMSIWKYWSLERFRNEYRHELLGPERHVWFERVVKEAETGTVTLLHRSYKKETQILPEDTTAYYLKEFLEMELLKRSALLQSQSLSLLFVSPENLAKQAVGRWANEGGR